MLVFLLFDVAAVIYTSAYLLHCMKRKYYFGAAGTGILLVLALFSGFLLLAYVS